jgi:hypothetical protein
MAAAAVSAPSLSLLDCATDPRWLGSYVPDWWPAQLEEFRALEDPEWRVKITRWGRQASKSTILAVYAIWTCVARPDLDLILPMRRVRYALVAAPSLDQSREFVQVARGVCESSEIVAPMCEPGADRITFHLPGGRRSCILAVPANQGTVRGKSASLICFEEHAAFNVSAGPGSDERMWLALRPSLRRFGDLGRVVSISTPAGSEGTFWRLDRDARAGVLPRATVSHKPTWMVDPSYSEEQRAADLAELGADGFASEIAAEFVEAGTGAVFDLSGVKLADGPVPPHAGREWKIAIDLALARDRLGIACVGKDAENPGRLVTGAVASLEPPRVKAAANETLEEQQERERTMLERIWPVIEGYAGTAGAVAIADTYRGGPLKAHLQAKGLPVTLVSPSSSLDTQRCVALRSRLIEDRTLTCHAECPQLLRELRRIRTSPAGKIVFPRFTEAGITSHCDTAQAFLSAVFAHGSGHAVPMGKPSGGPRTVTICKPSDMNF